jgi:hypothetical protein
MPENLEQFDLGGKKVKVFYKWEIPEFTNHQRSNLWYLIMIAAAVVLIIYSIIVPNYFFALIIIIAAFILFLRRYEPAQDVTFRITEAGIIVGNQVFPYENLANFYIVYDPPVKKLYFKLKGFNPDDLSIPLLDNNPLPIRSLLLEYLSEDLNKEHQTISDIFETVFKL